MGALLYLGVKFLAYSLWCYFGLHKFRLEQRAAFTGALATAFSDSSWAFSLACWFFDQQRPDVRARQACRMW